MPDRTCPTCSTPLRRKGSHGPWPTYCSRSCGDRASYARRADEGRLADRPKVPSLRRERDCEVCSRPMGVVNRNKRTCSGRCREILAGKLCSTTDCERPLRARGMCVSCLSRVHREENGYAPYVHTEAQVDKYYQRRAAMYGAQKGDPVHRPTIYARDGWICQLCREPVDPALAYPDPWSASLDHRTPIALGGLHDPSNAQLAHLRCNVRKGDALS